MGNYKKYDQSSKFIHNIFWFYLLICWVINGILNILDVNTRFIGKIPSGIPNQINLVIEIPKGSNIKYEIDKDSGLLFVDRKLFTAMFYPCNYGFIPSTMEDDGDPVDV